MLEEMKEIIELATNASTFVKNIIDITSSQKVDEDSAQIGSSGYSAKIGSSGDSAQIGSSGDSAQIGSSGYYAQIGSSGYYAQIGSSGYSAKIGSSGYYAQIGSSGDSAQIGSSGYSAKIGSSGDSAQIGSSGDSAQIDSTGEKSVVAAIGYWSIAKGKKGSWITLAEYRLDENRKYYPYFVKSEYVDGERIKEDTYYGLYNKEFREVIEVDGVQSLLIKTKNNIREIVLRGEYIPSYIFAKDGIYAHGRTVKQAYRDWLFKQSDRDVSKYENIKPDDIYDLNFWYECYRNITGACATGTENFIEQYKPKNKMTLDEVIEITQGQYGHNTFVEFFKK